MNLSDLRDQLGILSGRLDLTEENPDLADFFINEGSRFLDRNSTIQKSYGTFYGYVSSGGWYLEVPSSRGIKKVYVANTEGRYEAKKITLEEMLIYLMSERVANLTSGSPYYYCPAVTRNIPEGATLPTNITDYIDVLTTTGQNYNAILLSPPADGQYLISIEGLFYSKTLTAETDENFWSVNHPSLLLQSALREIEVFNRNSAGVKDWESAIMTILDGINKDLIEEEIADIDQMED